MRRLEYLFSFDGASLTISLLLPLIFSPSNDTKVTRPKEKEFLPRSVILLDFSAHRLVITFQTSLLLKEPDPLFHILWSYDDLLFLTRISYNLHSQI